MNCTTEPRELSLYVDDDLTPASGLRIRRHLASCPRCTQTVDSFRAVEALYREVSPPVAVPRDFRARTMERVRAARKQDGGPQRGRLLRPFVAIAAAVAAILMLVVWLGTPPARIEGRFLEMTDSGVWMPTAAESSVVGGVAYSVPNVPGVVGEFRFGSSSVKARPGAIVLAIDPSGGRIELIGGTIDVHAGEDDGVFVQTRSGEIYVSPSSDARIEIAHPRVPLDVRSKSTAALGVVGVVSSTARNVVDRDVEKSAVRIECANGTAYLETDAEGPRAKVDKGQVLAFDPGTNESWISAGGGNRTTDLGAAGTGGRTVDAILGSATKGVVAACGVALDHEERREAAVRVLIGLARSLGKHEVELIAGWLQEEPGPRQQAALWVFADRADRESVDVERIIELVRTPADEESRVAGIVALLNLNVSSRPSIEALVAATGEEVPLTTRVLAVRALYELDERDIAGDVVFHLLHSLDGDEVAAARRLVRSGVRPTKEEQQIAILRNSARHGPAATSLAWRWASDARLAPILDRLRDQSTTPAVRMALVGVLLERIGSPDVRHALSELEDTTPDEQNRIALALLSREETGYAEQLLARRTAERKFRIAAKLLMRLAEKNQAFNAQLDDWRSTGVIDERGFAVMLEEARKDETALRASIDGLRRLLVLSPEQESRVAPELLGIMTSTGHIARPAEAAELLVPLIRVLDRRGQADAWNTLAAYGHESAREPLRAYVEDEGLSDYSRLAALNNLALVDEAAAVVRARAFAGSRETGAPLREASFVLLARYREDPGTLPDLPPDARAKARFWIELARDRSENANFVRAESAWMATPEGTRAIWLGYLANFAKSDSRLHTWLIDLLRRDPSATVRLEAARGLLLLGNAAELIDDLLHDEFWAIRVTVAARDGASPDEIEHALRSRPSDLAPSVAEAFARALGCNTIGDVDELDELASRFDPTRIHAFVGLQYQPARRRGSDHARSGALRATSLALEIAPSQPHDRLGAHAASALGALFEATN